MQYVGYSLNGFSEECAIV